MRIRNRGFTLIELMITVAIVGILAAIAFPSYQNQIRKGHRADAQTLVMNIATKEQQYLLDARKYLDTIGAGGLNITISGWDCAVVCTNAHYTIDVAVTAGPPTFKVTATAKGNQLPDGDLTLDHQGNRTRAGKPGW